MYIALIVFFALLPGSSLRLREITVEDFRCKGDSGENPPIVWNGETFYDGDSGTLPRRGIDPDLLDLLNDLQNEINSQVFIISGYRSIKHNRYIAADLYKYVNENGDSGNPHEVSMTSKHIMGAAADFYVEGYEDRPENVLESLLKVIEENGDSSYPVVSKVGLRPRSSGSVYSYYAYPSYKTDIWWIHPYAENEGRDLDCRVYSGVYFHINKRIPFDETGCEPVR
ncbi:DUF882 domain-containing protein [candidate division WOR-3 bacterium]|nr:DUF882 domain-containing protein [candidate division WOR-3 bacterium]